MKLSLLSPSVIAASTFFLSSLVLACNPLTETGCPADTALGRTVNVDFTAGPSSEFTASYNVITYESDGVHLTVSEHGDAPILVSNWYIMFGRLEIVFKSAPGVGMVSSAILQSDDLDEIDWELLGATPSEAQSNYFGRGVTETYDREVTVADPTGQTEFNTYVIDWNQDRIIWSINGVTLRTLYAANADIDSSGKTEYPQTPMQIKIGAWAGGDPANAPGTITWAGGEINYSGGPYSMVIKSLSVTDYSTGSEYEYAGTSGSWHDITAVGGTVLGAASGSTSPNPVSSVASSSAAATTSTASTSSSTLPSSYETFPTSTSSSSVDTHTGWPWVASSTVSSAGTAAASTSATMTYTGSASSSVETATSSLISPSSYSSATSSLTSGEEATQASSSTASVISASFDTVTYASTSTAIAATSQMATLSSSGVTPSYTGGAVNLAVAKMGSAACVAAGLFLFI